MPSRLWDPREVLYISDDHRCVGFAVSKNRKCRMRLNPGDLSKADTLIESISREQPDAEALRRKLRQLALLLLCSQWHRGQVENIVEEWADSIEFDYPYGMIVEQHRAQPSASSSPSVSPRRSTPSVPRVSTPTYLDYRASRTFSTATPTFSSVPTPIYRSPRTLSTTTPTFSGVPSSNTSNTSAQDSSRFSTVRNSSSTSAVRPQAQTSTSATATSAVLSRPPASPSFSSNTIRSQAVHSASSSNRSENTAVSSSTSPGRLEVRQRTIDDECHICKEDFLSSDLIMWCKTGCGRSVHSKCFEDWQKACDDSLRDASCVFCRAAWENQTAVLFREPTLCTRTHVRRLGTDDECPICQEDYRPDESTTWCKSGCGRTVHRDCFEEWQKNLDNHQMSVTCIFCRRVWESDCECNE